MSQFYITEKLGPQQAFTPEGFLVIHDVPLARTGTQLYSADEVPVKGDSLGRVLINRDEAEVFRPQTIASLQGKPITLDHPVSDVTPTNWRDLSVGHVANPRRGTGRSAHLLFGDLFVTCSDVIKAVRNGSLREVSVGYDASYEDYGEGRGAQKDIVCNHLALVEHGRCGPICRIGDKALEVVRDACTCGAPIKDADLIDTVTVDIPLLIRLMEYAREDAKDDEALHVVAEKASELAKQVSSLTMTDYNEIVGKSTHDKENYPVKLTLELTNLENLKRFIDFWRYVQKTAAQGHSFMIEADRGAHTEKYWPYSDHPKVYIDGDGSDRIGRILLNGDDVTEPDDTDGPLDTNDKKPELTRNTPPRSRRAQIYVHAGMNFVQIQ